MAPRRSSSGSNAMIWGTVISAAWISVNPKRKLSMTERSDPRPSTKYWMVWDIPSINASSTHGWSLHQTIPGPRSFPPLYRRRPFTFRSVSTRCLLTVAGRFPTGFSPAPPWLLWPQQSPIRHIAPWHRFARPVGSVVVFLRRARRSRVGAGWGSPRIVFLAWRPVRRQTVTIALSFMRGCLEKRRV